MRKYILVLLIVSIVSCKNDTKSESSVKENTIDTEKKIDGFMIKGTTLDPDDTEISMYLAHSNDSLQLIASTSAVNNQFVFEGKVPQPNFYILKTNAGRSLKVFLENSEISVFMAKTDFSHEIQSTSPLSNAYKVLHEKLNVIKTKTQLLSDSYKDDIEANDSKQIEKYNVALSEINNSKKEIITDFIKLTDEKQVAMLVLKDNIELLDVDFVKESYTLFPSSVKNNSDGMYIADFIKTKDAEKVLIVEKAKKEVVIKKKVPFRPTAYAFSGRTQEGTQMSLASVSQGKVVLIDFWASWCQPCRVQSPHIVAMYKKYKDRGFEILSVSEDTNESAWSKAIIDDHYTWNTHVIDNNKSIAFRYGIDAIPHTVLIDRNGKIAAEKLSGRSLEEKIKQLLNE